MNSNYLKNDAPLCRTCCNTSDLVSLLQPENKHVTKKLRACADITIEIDDALPKYICTVCLQNLESAYSFKIQCEFMDRKFRDSLTTMKIEAIEMVEGAGDRIEGEMEYMEDISTIYDEEYNYFGEDSNKMEDVVYLEQNEYPVEVLEYPKSSPEIGMDSGIQQKCQPSESFQTAGTIISPPNTNQNCVNGRVSNCLVEQTITHIGNATPIIQVKRAFKCDSCSEIFNCYNQYNEHKKSHGQQRYQCSTCERWFAKRFRLKMHEKTHTGLKLFSCTTCSKRYTNQGNLDRHIRITHNKERQYTCAICNKGFAQAAVLRQHQSVHTTDCNFSCDLCQKSFKTELYLKMHKQRHLPSEQRPKRIYKPSARKYKPVKKLCICTECGKQSSTLVLHKSHMRTHSKEKSFECGYCKKRFRFRQSLQNHIYLHTGEKKFRCDICGMSFRQIGHLQGHKVVHTGLKAHSCKICGRSFGQRGNLTVHMRKHLNSNDLPHRCEICSKGFHETNSLKRHQLSHVQKNIMKIPAISLPSIEPINNDAVIKNDDFRLFSSPGEGEPQYEPLEDVNTDEPVFSII